MRDNFIRALPIVAKALSDNYGVSLVIRGNQAMTNGNYIVLPVLPEDDEKAVVLARGYLDHEAAHVKFSDFDLTTQSGFEIAVTNILEDVRIEEAMSRKYPGCRENLHALTRLLVAEGDFKASEATDPPAKVVQSYLSHLLRARILNQQALEPLASQDQAIFDRLFPGLRANLESIALEVKDATNTQTVRDLARRIAVLFQEAAPPSPAESGPEKQDDPDQGESDNGASHSQAEASPAANDEPPDSSSASQTEGEEDEQENGDQTDSFDSEQSENQKDGADQSDAKPEDKQESPAGHDQEQSADGEEAEDVSPDSSPDDGDQDNSPEVNENNQKEGEQSQPSGSTQMEQDSQADGGPDDGQEADDQPGENENIQPGEQTGEAQVSQRGVPGSQSGGLLAAAEALADEKAYHDLGQTVAGKLNAISPQEGGLEMAMEMSPWWQGAQPVESQELLQTTARLRAMLAGVVQAKRAGKDRSSLSGTRLNLRSLARLAINDGRVFVSRQERTAVNTAVYLLMDQSGSMKNLMRTAFLTTAALMQGLRSIPGTAVAVGTFSTFEADDDKQLPYVASLLGFNEHERRMSLTQPPHVGNTPMAEAIYCVASRLLFRREPRRLLIVMTDGEPDNVEATQEIIRKCRSAGLEVYGVGIMEEAVKPLFGEQCAIVVKTLDELPERLFRLLANRL